MTELIYKTRPKIFILLIPFLGAIFCHLLCWLIWIKSKHKIDVISLSLLIILSSLSLISLVSFIIQNKIIKLTNESIIISYLFLPIKKTFAFNEITNISQKTKDIYGLLPDTFAFTKSFIYNSTITTFKFSYKNQIEIRSVGEEDFEKFHNAFRKIKNKEGKIKKNRQNMIEYIACNLDGIFWGIFLIVLTIGLTHELLIK